MVSIIEKRDSISIHIDATKIPELRNLTAEEQKHLYRAALVDELKDEAREHLRALKTDKRLDALLDEFIQAKRSAHTRTMYAGHILAYREYLERVGVSFGIAKATHVRAWVRSLKGSPNTIRAKVAAVSSFYAFLVREDVTRSNPCANVELPRKQYKKALRPDMQHGGSSVPVMSQGEARKILEWLKRDPYVSQIVTDSVTLMLAHGLRVGALPTLKRTAHGFSVTTKGKRQSFTAENVPDVSGVTVRMITHAVRRAVRALYSAGDIRHPYTCHDFRHCFAVTHYKRHKDVVALKSALGHASINVTDVYLQSVGFC